MGETENLSQPTSHKSNIKNSSSILTDWSFLMLKFWFDTLQLFTHFISWGFIIIIIIIIIIIGLVTFYSVDEDFVVEILNRGWFLNYTFSDILTLNYFLTLNKWNIND